MIPLPTPFGTRIVNCWLLKGGPLTLVDPGPNWDLDHVGLAAVVRERSGAQVVGHHLLGDFLADLPGSMKQEDDYQAAVMLLHGVPEQRIRELQAISEVHRRYVASVGVDRVLHAGDSVEMSGRSYSVEFRSGHSRTDTIFVDRDGRTAIVGDHLIGNISPNPGRPPAA